MRAPECYANGPFGLEQGFTLGHRPDGAGRLRLAVGTIPSGERARLDAGGSSLALIGSMGRVLLRYGSLSVTDAAGRRLPARIAQAGATVLLSVDDAGARYPVTIDPLAEAAESTSCDGTAGDGFGSSWRSPGTRLWSARPTGRSA